MARLSGGAASLVSMAGISADGRPNPRWNLGLYDSHAWDKAAVADMHPQNRNAQFAFLELTYHRNAPLHARR